MARAKPCDDNRSTLSLWRLGPCLARRGSASNDTRTRRHQMPAHWITRATGALLTLLALAVLPRIALATDAPEKPALTMAVGGLPGLYYLPVLAAKQLGYFKDEGLDVTLEDFAGGSK